MADELASSPFSAILLCSLFLSASLAILLVFEHAKHDPPYLPLCLLPLLTRILLLQIECLCSPQIHVNTLSLNVMVLEGEVFWEVIRLKWGALMNGIIAHIRVQRELSSLLSTCGDRTKRQESGSHQILNCETVPLFFF